MNRRMRALMRKELAELRRNPGLFVPALLTAVIGVALPFVIAVLVPAVTGERLSDSSDFREASNFFRGQPWAQALDAEGLVQALVLHQVLLMLVVAPVAASMSTAAYTVIGEKQARTLEPILATPITTTELLGAKILGAFAPAMALTVASFAASVALAVALMHEGVYRALLAPGALAVVFVTGPLAALAALQMTVCVSSRTNDPRSAQQIGAFIIIPVGGLLMAQVVGSLVLTARLALVIAAGLALLNLGLLRLGVRLFQRESILTRWK